MESLPTFCTRKQTQGEGGRERERKGGEREGDKERRERVDLEINMTRVYQG